MAASPFEIPDRFNAASFFVDRHVEEGRGGKTALFTEDGEITYAQLQEMVNRAGNALRELGVEAEQRVLCLLLDSPAFLATFWGAIKIGAIPIPINTMMRSQDYLYFLNDSRAKVAVISEALLAEAGPILSQATHLKHVVVAGKPSGSQIGFETWLSRAGSALEAAATSKDDAWFWLYSSGSTRFPKGRGDLQHDLGVCSGSLYRPVLGRGEDVRTLFA